MGQQTSFTFKAEPSYFDVVVAGGGPAGAAAAIACARNGAKTLLLEKNGFLGGMATGGAVPAFCTFTDGEKVIVRGIGLEILEKLKERTWRSPFYDRKKGRIEGLDWLPIDSEALKSVLDEMTTSSGCELLFHTTLIGCREEKGQIKSLIIHNKSGLQAVEAHTYIDCTGDGDLAAMSGCITEMGDEEGQVQGGTLCFKVANFNTEKFLEYAKAAGENGNLIKAVTRAREQGDFPEGESKVAGIALCSPGTASFNFGHVYDWNPVNGESLTKAELTSRQYLPRLMNFIRTYVPGAEEAVLAASGPDMGVRESRRVRGKYYMTLEDYLRRADFADAIGYYSYPVDIHGARGTDSKLEQQYRDTAYKPGESYGIPFRCLIPEGVENLLMAGRQVSCDRYMQASLRVMPACFLMGQAAGTAAAIAVKEQVPAGEVDGEKLRETLRNQGCYLR